MSANGNGRSEEGLRRVLSVVTEGETEGEGRLRAIEARAHASTPFPDPHRPSGTLWRNGAWLADVSRSEDLYFWKDARADALYLLEEIRRLRRRMEEVRRQVDAIRTEEGSVDEAHQLVALHLLSSP